MNLITLITILSAVIVLIVGGFLAFAFYSSQRTKHLKEDFGPEYDRAIESMGNQKEAEESLEERQERLEAYTIRELDVEEKEYFLKKWKDVQAGFVNHPGGEVQEADRFVAEVMLACGYPVAQFDRRVENLSVKHPELVSQYHQAHSVAERNRQSDTSIEQLRQAMINYQSILEELLDLQSNKEPEPASIKN